MQSNILAPWAELVPDTGPMTVDELMALPDDGWRYELVEGRLVRMPPPGGEHGRLAFRLGVALHAFVTPAHLGEILAAETGFQLGLKTVLAADVAFVRADHIPARDSAEWKQYWRHAPDIVAEVVSPSQKRDDMDAKARAWLAAGVSLVWIVWPATQQVDVWHHIDTDAPDRPVPTLGTGDALDGLNVLPGFTYPLADLFA